MPATAAVPPTLSSVTVNPPTVTGGSTATGTVSLTGPAPSAGLVVSLSSDKPDIVAFVLDIRRPMPIPAAHLQVTVPAGATAANFTVTTKPVAFNPNVVPPGVSVLISASHQALGLARPPMTKTATLTVLTPLVKSLGVAGPITGSQDTSGLVELTGPAPSGGAAVHLASSNTAVATVPANVTVPAGASSANFTVTTKPVTAPASADISANRSRFDIKKATLNVLQGPDLMPYIGTFWGECSKPCDQCPPITIGIGVKNQAGAPVTSSFVIKLEGAHSYTKTVASITGGGSVSLGRFSYPWPCVPPGTESQTQNPPNHRITVDTTNAVAESNENNNSKDFYMPPNASFTPQ